MMIFIKSLSTNIESSLNSQITISSTIKKETEKIIEVTWTVGNKLAKIVNIDLDLLSYVKAISHSDKA